MRAGASRNPERDSLPRKCRRVEGHPHAAFAVRASYHSLLNASPGQLIFGQDMISRKLYEANWGYMSKRRFDAILAANDRENDKRQVIKP
ncbi:hypothetical protein ON010_g15581 [Phytophthora cinnamomi]|nr:hypothetical protein ON010_g15581 [Phytophthora cinnamomi]